MGHEGAFNSEWVPEPSIWDPGSFVPASSQGPPSGAIVLHEAFLDFPSTSGTGMPGIFTCPSEYKNPKKPPSTLHQQASYDLTTGDIPLSSHKIVRYVIYPASDTTIIPMNLGNDIHSSNNFSINPRNVKETKYFLKSKESRSSLVSGVRTNVKLDFVIWWFERFTREGGIYGGAAQQFQIDGAVLLDPKRPNQFRPSGTPVCLLGMDFLMKYPYLLFEPKYDTRGEVDFMLAKGPLMDRPYKTFTEVNKKLIVHISARHDAKTGNIGCGVFFKSGSILNLFSGVSKYDKNGEKHTKQLWERGVLMGVIKALHIVGAFPVGHEFTDVIIRTGSPPTNSLLSQMQHTADGLHKKIRNGYDDPSVDDRFSCPSPNSDLVMYICHQFISKQPGIKIHFDGFSTKENYDSVEAAGILAAAGAEMEEFYMEKEDKSIFTHRFSGYSINQFRGHKHASPDDITLLHQHSGFVGNSIYVSLGLDGYFHIHKERAHAAMTAADKKTYSTLCREDAVCRLGYAPWEGDVAAAPNGFLDSMNYEYHAISPPSDFRTLNGILGEDTTKVLRACLKESPEFIPDTLLGLIKNSNREIMIHEFLSMQTKHYREEYIKELERRGLEKGWHFCKDRTWNGYLRRNTRIYNRDGWAHSQGKNHTDDCYFALSNKNKDPSGGDWESCIQKLGKIEEMAREEIKPTGAKKQMGRYLKTTKNRTEASVKSQIKKVIREIDNRSDSDPENSQYQLHLTDSIKPIKNRKRPVNSVNLGTNGTWARVNGESNHLTDFVEKRMAHMGIGDRVAARRRYGLQRSRTRQMKSRNGYRDYGPVSDSSNDSTYIYSDDAGDTGNRSSEHWSDSETSTNSNGQTITSNTSYREDQVSSTKASHQMKPHFHHINRKGEGFFDEESENCTSGPTCSSELEGLPIDFFGSETSSSSEQVLHNNFEHQKQHNGRREKAAMFDDERRGNRWPDFHLLLENFRKDSSTAVA